MNKKNLPANFIAYAVASCPPVYVPKNHGFISYEDQNLQFRSHLRNAIVKKRPKNAEKLPYDEIYPEQVLKEIGTKRFNDHRLLMRGDRRSPQEIFAIGGFHPRCTVDYHLDLGARKLGLMPHRMSPKGSGLVSFTSNPLVAYWFGLDAALSVQNFAAFDTYFYSFTACVVGAIKAPPFSKGLDAEEEFLVPGGIDAEDIVCVRQNTFRATGPNFSGPLFFKQKFVEQHPQSAKKVALANLRADEACPDLGIDENVFTARIMPAKR